MQKVLTLVLLLLAFIGCSVQEIRAQTTEFTYQGSLKDNAASANGNYDFEFALFDALSGGGQIGATIPKNNVPVMNGIFAVKLDFGSAFPGATRYLEVRVRLAGQPGITTLAPRQPLTSSPYSVKSINADAATSAATATNALQLGGVAANQYVLTTDPRMSDPRDPTAGSSNYIQNTTATQIGSSFHISDTGIAGVFDSALGYRIGGYSVLSAPGSGLTNIFSGYRAGNLAVTGTNNSAFGHIAGENITTGYDNSFFGRSSGAVVTTGYFNTFAGTDSGSSTTNGHSNSFFGRDAGKTNVTGSYNAFFGYQAGLYSGGSENSFFGPYAGEYHGNGNGNTYLGRYSGINNSTGNYNIAIGYNSGFTADGFSFATAIGTDAMATSSNQITLGRGNGADTVRIPGSLNVSGLLTANINADSITSGIVGTAFGGTGLNTPGLTGNYLRSNGATWTSSPIFASDIPAGSDHYIRNSTNPQP